MAAPPDGAGPGGSREATVAEARRTTFYEVPGGVRDLTRDYDLATLGYEETEYFVEGTAVSYELAGERGTDGRWDVTAGRRGAVPDADGGAAPDGPGALQRDGGGGVAQRLGRHGRGAGLDVPPPSSGRPGPRLGRGLGPEGGHRRRRVRRGLPPEIARPRALCGARAPGRRLVLRHLHPGRRLAGAARGGEPAAGARTVADVGAAASRSPPPAWSPTSTPSTPTHGSSTGSSSRAGPAGRRVHRRRLQSRRRAPRGSRRPAR